MIPEHLRATDEPPTRDQRLRAWWVRYERATGITPDVRTHKMQLRLGLTTPVEPWGERRALRLRPIGVPRS